MKEFTNNLNIIILSIFSGVLLSRSNIFVILSGILVLIVALIVSINTAKAKLHTPNLRKNEFLANYAIYTLIISCIYLVIAFIIFSELHYFAVLLWPGLILFVKSVGLLSINQKCNTNEDVDSLD